MYCRTLDFEVEANNQSFIFYISSGLKLNLNSKYFLKSEKKSNFFFSNYYAQWSEYR